MATRTVATARRTQLVSTYGVGSLLPSMDESFMVCGLDEWFERSATEVPEPRLARSMGVETLRMPPTGSAKGKDVPTVRFPVYHFCPGCRRLARHREFGAWDESRCHECSRPLTPSRFVVCCSNGHIDDFPYHPWAHRQQDSTGEAHRMKLRARGRTSSLADIVIECSCGIAPVSMAGSFGPQALQQVAGCRGLRPWLPGAEPQLCDETPRTLQRGSSNVWFGVVRSAISIPPWSEGVHRVINRHWAVLQGLPTEHLALVIPGMNIVTPEAPLDALVQAIRERRGEFEDEIPTDDDLRREEYEALRRGRPETSRDQQFVAVPVTVAAQIREFVPGVSNIPRLREVRALEGFTRVHPPLPGDKDRVAALSLNRTRWLPAIEVLGEGIFLEFEGPRLDRWEAGEFARQRAAMVRVGIELAFDGGGPPPQIEVQPRQLLLHSLAHLLLNELSLDAGYASASLRERLYVGPEQAGVLIYTASADSAGSLGGLSAQSAPSRMADVLVKAVRRASWCSADPVCIEATSTGSDAANLAACHACILLPETSCELMNSRLDRACVVGTPDDPGLGYFGALLTGE